MLPLLPLLLPLVLLPDESWASSMMEKRFRVRCRADAGWKEGDELGVAAAVVSLGGAGDDCRANCMKLEGVRESGE